MSDQTDTPTATSLVDLIDKLIEPPAPEAVSMAPQTWGWVALVVIVGALLLWVGLRRRRWQQQNAYRRQALLEMDTQGATVADAAAVLRRSALVAFPRAQVASLTGEAWIRFLEETGRTTLDRTVADELSHLPYAAPDQQLSDGARAAVETWLRQHRREDTA